MGTRNVQVSGQFSESCIDARVTSPETNGYTGTWHNSSPDCEEIPTNCKSTSTRDREHDAHWERPGVWSEQYVWDLHVKSPGSSGLTSVNLGPPTQSQSQLSTDSTCRKNYACVL